MLIQQAFDGIKIFKQKRPAIIITLEMVIVLAVVAIIGFVIIMGVSQKSNEKRSVSQLLSAMSDLSMVLRFAEDEAGSVSAWILSPETSEGAQAVFSHLQPYLKVKTDCGTVDRNNLCVEKSYRYLNKKPDIVNYALDPRYYKVILKNNITLMWKVSEDFESITFYVDTNNTTSPNMWGKDFFAFVYKNSVLSPAGGPGTSSSVNTDCLNKKSSGMGCAYYVIQNKNQKYLH